MISTKLPTLFLSVLALAVATEREPGAAEHSTQAGNKMELRRLLDETDQLLDEPEPSLVDFDLKTDDSEDMFDPMAIEEIDASDLQEIIDLTNELDGGDGERKLQVVSGSWHAMIVNGFGEGGRAVGVSSNANNVYPFLRNPATNHYLQWYFVRVSGSNYGRVYNRAKQNGKWMCLDNNFSFQNAYVHECHSGNNQRWRPYSQGELRSLHDGLCLDYDFNNDNMWLHECHSNWNQEFIWANPPVSYFMT